LRDARGEFSRRDALTRAARPSGKTLTSGSVRNFTDIDLARKRARGTLGMTIAAMQLRDDCIKQSYSATEACELRRLIGFAVLAALVTVSMASSAVSTPPTAWSPGEALSYTVNFGIFRAGTTSFMVARGPVTSERPTYKFRSILQSSPRFFYSIFDEAVSISDEETFATYRYEKIQRESGESSSNVTVFNQGRGTAQRTEDATTHPVMNFTKNSLDVLGAIYFVRNQNLAVGRTLTVPVHDGKRDYTMKVTIRKREPVTTKAGVFNCLLVEPRLYQEDGTLKRKGQITLWMTDDSRHLPVRIRMALAFGSITATLDSMTGTLPAR
jgi:hypothetical protein